MFDQLTMFERLGVFVVRDFLDRQLCQQILAEIRQVNKVRPGEVHKGQGEFAVDETIRKVQQTKLSKSIVETSRGRAGNRSPTLPFGTGHATFTASGYWVVGFLHK